MSSKNGLSGTTSSRLRDFGTSHNSVLSQNVTKFTTTEKKGTPDLKKKRAKPVGPRNFSSHARAIPNRSGTKQINQDRRKKGT